MDATRPDAVEPPLDADAAPLETDGTPLKADVTPPETEVPPEEPGASNRAVPPRQSSQPGVGEAIGGLRAAFMRMIDAHVALLRAELAVTGKELGIIVGLALAAFVIAVLTGILLYVGSFLFLGQWLFGSMGWGIIHGTLLGACLIGFVAIDLAGGKVRPYAIGALVGLVVTIVLSLLLITNVGNESAEWAARIFGDQVPDGDLPVSSDWVPTLIGLVIGALVLAVVAAIAGWRAKLRGNRLVGTVLVAAAAGGLVGAIYASTRYDAPDGVVGLAIAIGLITWIVVGALLAKRAGFDTEARYANLKPRASIASFGETKDFLMEEFERQKKGFLSR